MGCKMIAGDLFECVGLFAQAPCAGGDAEVGIGKRCAQHRQHLVAQAVARMLRLGIGRVVDHLKIVLLRITLQCAARHVQQRAPQQALRITGQRPQPAHAGQSFVAGTVQQAQHQGFDLVVAVMRQRE